MTASASLDDLRAAVPRLAVLDDELDVAKGLARGLSRKGFAVELIEPVTPELDTTVEAIMGISDAALCDHALRGGLNVAFSGAQVVAALRDRGFPAVLFTGVRPEDQYEIRRNMARIPGFLHRDQEEGLTAARVLDELGEAVEEVRDGRVPRRRRPRRTLVTVTGSRLSGNETLVAVLISGWPHEGELEIPADLLAPSWAENPHDAVGRTFFAQVNIGEADEDKLYFKDFESEPADTTHFRGLAER